ncbi:hypothetical protein [Metapseudomonas otitidis]|uniref:hypothetical protein n=1 Tax=Metapseudomonas otitidis TaxID=319939 RepID=UPI0024473973|nr:hypothetical protein [Pseudomonas otitidis]MDG9780293.1 hypothetical protein [Pseudomonas otitidis]
MINFLLGIAIGCFVMWSLFFLARAIGSETPIDNTDDTDSPTQRSGMDLHTDHKTGLQYLSVPGCGLTPRLKDNFQQMKVEDSQ